MPRGRVHALREPRAARAARSRAAPAAGSSCCRPRWGRASHAARGAHHQGPHLLTFAAPPGPCPPETCPRHRRAAASQTSHPPWARPGTFGSHHWGWQAPRGPPPGSRVHAHRAGVGPASASSARPAARCVLLCSAPTRMQQAPTHTHLPGLAQQRPGLQAVRGGDAGPSACAGRSGRPRAVLGAGELHRDLIKCKYSAPQFGALACASAGALMNAAWLLHCCMQGLLCEICCTELQ